MKARIFVSYHDRHPLVGNEIITPIQTGRAVSGQKFKGMLGDDTGDNISAANPRYNELSAQYWVWKQYRQIGNPDYVGFMHYRRHFVFDKKAVPANAQPWYPGMAMYRVGTLEHIKDNLAVRHIEQTLSSQADVYVIKGYDLRRYAADNRCVKDHYLNYIPGAKRNVWNKFVEVIKEHWPDYEGCLEQFIHGSTLHACNMFIMKRELFFEYNTFCFDVLQELDKRVDSRTFVGQEKRFLGFLAEYLLTIFVLKQQQAGKVIHELDALFVEQPDSSRRAYEWKKKLAFCLAVTKQDEYKMLTLFGRSHKLMRLSKVGLLQLQQKQQAHQLHVLKNRLEDLQEELALAGNKHLL